MTARVRPISSAVNAGQYFYFTERNYECSKGWQQNEVTKELGLEKITRESFENILSGKIKDGVHLGRITQDGLKHHPGQEITFTAPKSFSIMALVAEDKRLLAAHDKAVSETLEYMNRHLIYARVQKDGIKYQEKTNNTITAKFTHITSRAVKDADNDKKPDPGLHTHALVANATKCKDGEFRSIVFDKLYENQLNISELYNINLAREAKSLGYELNESKTSMGRYTFEINGVSEKDIKELSQRRSSILEAAKQTGVSDVKGLEYIAKSTRAEKIKETQEALLKNWIDRVNIKDLYSIKETALSNKNTEHQATTNLKDSLSFAISHLSERESVWETTTLHSTIWQKAPLDYTIKDIEKIIAAEVKDKNILTAYDENSSTYTTRKNLAMEKEVIQLMQDGKGKIKAIASTQHINKILDQSNLTIGQKDAVNLICTSKDRVVGIQGSAGTGKTTMLKTVKEIADERGIEMVGLAPTKAASQVFAQSVGIESKTLKSFIMKYDGVAKGRGTKEGVASMREDFANKLVILDEASLASSKDMKSLLKISERLDFKVVTTGDRKQQQAVEAGKPFYYLQEHGMNTAIQRDVVRQEPNSDLLKAVYASERAVDSETAAKDIYGSLKAIGSDNIVDVSKLKESDKTSKNKVLEPVNNNDLAEQTYKKWQSLKEEGKDPLLIAPSNDLRDKISELVRGNYIRGDSYDHNILKNTYKTRAEISDVNEYSGKEIISFEKDVKNLGIKAGDLFKIEKLNKGMSNDTPIKSSIELVRIGDNKKINWNPSKSNEFVSLYEKQSIKLAEGEKIKWTKNSNKHSFIINAETAWVDKIGKNKIKVKTESGKIHSLSKDDMRFMDYGYALSTYSSQGKTAGPVIGILRAKEKFLNLTHQRSFYVTISRAAKEVHLVIDNYKDLIKSLSAKTGDKSSAVSHQSKFDKNTIIAPEKSVDPEVKARVNLIRKTFAELVSKYDNFEKLNPSRSSLSTQIKDANKDLKLSEAAINKIRDNFIKESAYKNPQEALKEWYKLANKNGLDNAYKMVTKNPEVLGDIKGNKILFFTDKNRKEAMSKIKASANLLTDHYIAKDYLGVSQGSLDKLDKKYKDISKSNFNFKTKDISYTKFKNNIECSVKKSLWEIDRVESKNIISTISKRVEEQIIEYKNRYKKEPSSEIKSQIYSKAKYEYERKVFHLDKLNKASPAKTKLAKIKQHQKADCLSKIEANKLQQDHHKVFENLDQKALADSYNYYLKRTDDLTNTYIKQGYEKNQAYNIASKIVDYEIANNTHPSMTNLKVMEAKSATFNLDKTIISNMGINEKDSVNILSKFESIHSQKLNAKEKMKLGFRTYTQPEQNQQSANNSKGIEQDKSQAIAKNIDSGFSI